MAGTLALNKTDIKGVIIAVAIAAGGGLYYMYKNKGTGSGGISNLFGAGNNASSAANGTAGAIAGSSSINTYNVFPTVSSQSSGSSAFYNAGHGNVSPSAIHQGSTAWLSNGQGFSLPVKT